MKKRNPKSYALKEEEVKHRVESYGVQLVSSWLHWSVDRHRTRIRYVCKCGHETEAWLSNFYKVQNCHECGKKKKSGSNCYMWNPDRNAVAQAKYWRKACERIVRRCLKAAGSIKGDRTQKLLGYTPDELKEHIENHPNGYGKQPHHIDHIFPVQAFIDHDIFDLRLINRLDNLQPLPGGDNLSKADEYDEMLFLEWLNR